VKKILTFWRWIVGAAIGFGTIFFVTYKQHSAAEKYKHHREEYCAALVATAEQKKACIEERTTARDYLPWRYELIAWPEGITTWAIIATGFVIGWQSWETRKAAKAVEDQTREVALQNSNLIAKERARVAIMFPRETSNMTISTASRILMTNLAVNIVNQGGTVANEIWGGYDAFASTDEEEAPPSKNVSVLETPANLQSGSEEPIGPMKVDARYGEGTPYTFYIYVRGFVEYKTIFESDRKRTSFLLRREFVSQGGNKASSITWWNPCGRPEDNQST
jgi:hypothetical protein